MASETTHPPLAALLPSLVLGGAGFSYQSQADPASLPVRDIIKRAFDNGMLAIDTSPFYEPSEQLLGEALTHPQITAHYPRSSYLLMTKAGRLGPQEYNYTPSWIQHSVARSLARLHTAYLDVVFLHDIEGVSEQSVLAAVGALLPLVRDGTVRYIGLSSYRIDLLAARAALVRERYGRAVDVLQNWGQLTLQNARLASEGLRAFRDAGVGCVCSSSPLAIGLLRQGGVPRGREGDFHPAPEGLRAAAREVADWVGGEGEKLASLALRYGLMRAAEATREMGPALRVCTITGVSTLGELDENVETARRMLGEDFARAPVLDEAQVQRDAPLVAKAHEILGEWVHWTFPF